MKSRSHLSLSDRDILPAGGGGKAEGDTQAFLAPSFLKG